RSIPSTPSTPMSVARRSAANAPIPHTRGGYVETIALRNVLSLRDPTAREPARRHGRCLFVTHPGRPDARGPASVTSPHLSASRPIELDLLRGSGLLICAPFLERLLSSLLLIPLRFLRALQAPPPSLWSSRNVGRTSPVRPTVEDHPYEKSVSPACRTLFASVPHLARMSALTRLGPRPASRHAELGQALYSLRRD